jgi:hypothetical protein
VIALHTLRQAEDHLEYVLKVLRETEDETLKQTLRSFETDTWRQFLDDISELRDLAEEVESEGDDQDEEEEDPDEDEESGEDEEPKDQA